jgi:amino acid permease
MTHNLVVTAVPGPPNFLVNLGVINWWIFVLILFVIFLVMGKNKISGVMAAVMMLVLAIIYAIVAYYIF